MSGATRRMNEPARPHRPLHRVLIQSIPTVNGVTILSPNVTVENFEVKDASTGISVLADGVAGRNNHVHGCLGGVGTNASNGHFEGNHSFRNVNGFSAILGQFNTFVDNKASGSPGSGFVSVLGGNNSFERNTSKGNGLSGFEIGFSSTGKHAHRQRVQAQRRLRLPPVAIEACPLDQSTAARASHWGSYSRADEHYMSKRFFTVVQGPPSPRQSRIDGPRASWIRYPSALSRLAVTSAAFYHDRATGQRE